MMRGNAAFGDDPGRWPLPPRPRRTSCGCARSSPAARAATRAPSPTSPPCSAQRVGPLASLAHSTQASFLRQLGWHTAARPLGRPGAGGGRAPTERPRGRADRAGRRRAGRGPVRGVRGALQRAQQVRCSTDRCRRGCRCGWRGCPPSWRWPAATASPRSATPSARSSWRRRSARRGTPGQVGRHPGRGAVQRGRTRASRAVADAALEATARAGTHPAALGVGVPARRHRQRDAFGCAVVEDSRRVRRYGASRGGVWSDR